MNPSGDNPHTTAQIGSSGNVSSARGLIRIAIDAMGGDIGPEINIRGAVDALGEAPNLKILLVGNESLISQELAKISHVPKDRIQVVPAREVISMEDHAASVIRKKKDSSIHVGLELVKRHEADAFISAGNSGAVMAGALVILGRLAKVERPAIIVKLPTADGFIVLLDVGANVDCKPDHLVHFAEMGQVYTQVVERIASPRVALLSNGSESHKGNELTRNTHAILSAQKSLNYIGYIEGFDLFRGKADVVVCDGFVGNVCLKMAEGLADTTFKWFRKELQKDWMGLLGVIFLKRLLRNFRKQFDYQPYGAAPLLGIDGLVLISHGSSTEKAIKNGILTAKKAVEQQFMPRIRARMEIHLQKEDKKE